MFEMIAITFVCWYHATIAPYYLSHRDDIRRSSLMILDIDKTIMELEKPTPGYHATTTIHRSTRAPSHALVSSCICHRSRSASMFLLAARHILRGFMQNENLEVYSNRSYREKRAGETKRCYYFFLGTNPLLIFVMAARFEGGASSSLSISSSRESTSS